MDSDFETQRKEIAHNIRTIKSKQNNNQNRKSPKIKLFNPKQYTKRFNIS